MILDGGNTLNFCKAKINLAMISEMFKIDLDFLSESYSKYFFRDKIICIMACCNALKVWIMYVEKGYSKHSLRNIFHLDL